MQNKFDELTKGLAQSVTRRGALKELAVGPLEHRLARRFWACISS